MMAVKLILTALILYASPTYSLKLGEICKYDKFKVYNGLEVKSFYKISQQVSLDTKK